MVVVPITQCPAKGRNAAVQIAFLDKRLSPDPVHQFVFADRMAAVFDQNKQNVKNLGVSCTGSSKRSRRALALYRSETNQTRKAF
jgi:hypothetical protein